MIILPSINIELSFKFARRAVHSSYLNYREHPLLSIFKREAFPQPWDDQVEFWALPYLYLILTEVPSLISNV